MRLPGGSDGIASTTMWRQVRPGWKSLEKPSLPVLKEKSDVEW